MKTCWFTVIRVGDDWWIDCEGKAYGPVPDKEEAERYARLIAETYGPADRQSMVWAPDENGRYTMVWAAGEAG